MVGTPVFVLQDLGTRGTPSIALPHVGNNCATDKTSLSGEAAPKNGTYKVKSPGKMDDSDTSGKDWSSTKEQLVTNSIVDLGLSTNLETDAVTTVKVKLAQTSSKNSKKRIFGYLKYKFKARKSLHNRMSLGTKSHFKAHDSPGFKLGRHRSLGKGENTNLSTESSEIEHKTISFRHRKSRSATRFPNPDKIAKNHRLKWERIPGSPRRKWKEGKGHKVKMKSSLGSCTMERWKISSSHQDEPSGKVKKKQKRTIRYLFHGHKGESTKEDIISVPSTPPGSRHGGHQPSMEHFCPLGVSRRARNRRKKTEAEEGKMSF